MSTNVGGIDRAFRIIVGLAIVLWGLLYGNFWGLIGLVPLLTGIMQKCPVYILTGFNTCDVKEELNKQG